MRLAGVLTAIALAAGMTLAGTRVFRLGSAGRRSLAGAPAFSVLAFSVLAFLLLAFRVHSPG